MTSSVNEIIINHDEVRKRVTAGISSVGWAAFCSSPTTLYLDRDFHFSNARTDYSVFDFITTKMLLVKFLGNELLREKMMCGEDNVDNHKEQLSQSAPKLFQMPVH